MRLPHLWFVVAFMAPMACKTPGSAQAEAFTVNGDLAAAHALIVQSVARTYPQLQGNSSVIDQFATGLQNGDTLQASGSDKFLQLINDKKGAGDTHTEFDSYVAAQFAALTNYTTVIKTPGTALVYTGLPIK